VFVIARVRGRIRAENRFPNSIIVTRPTAVRLYTVVDEERLVGNVQLEIHLSPPLSLLGLKPFVGTAAAYLVTTRISGYELRANRLIFRFLRANGNPLTIFIPYYLYRVIPDAVITDFRRRAFFPPAIAVPVRVSIHLCESLASTTVTITTTPRNVRRRGTFGPSGHVPYRNL